MNLGLRLLASTGRWANWLKRNGAILYAKNSATDKTGRSDVTPMLGRSGAFLVGEKIESSHITTQTITSHDGDAVLSISAGEIACTTAGDAYNILLSDGTLYPCPILSGSDAIWPDISGNGKHATASVASVSAHINEHEDPDGYDLNALGWTVADGSTQYWDEYMADLIPADVIIPALADSSGCAAYEEVV